MTPRPAPEAKSESAQPAPAAPASLPAPAEKPKAKEKEKPVSLAPKKEEPKQEDAYLAPGADVVAFVAVRPSAGLGGFLEASLRKYADGCSTSPVGYIGGWYVDPDLRQQGVGGMLVRAAEAWAAQQGCTEMAADCLLDNTVRLAAHLALGYEEAERLIHFRKSILTGISL